MAGAPASWHFTPTVSHSPSQLHLPLALHGTGGPRDPDGRWVAAALHEQVPPFASAGSLELARGEEPAPVRGAKVSGVEYHRLGKYLCQRVAAARQQFPGTAPMASATTSRQQSALQTSASGGIAGNSTICRVVRTAPILCTVTFTQ